MWGQNLADLHISCCYTGHKCLHHFSQPLWRWQLGSVMTVAGVASGCADVTARIKQLGIEVYKPGHIAKCSHCIGTYLPKEVQVKRVLLEETPMHNSTGQYSTKQTFHISNKLTWNTMMVAASINREVLYTMISMSITKYWTTNSIMYTSDNVRDYQLHHSILPNGVNCNSWFW